MKSEDEVKKEIMIEAPYQGIALWRNNVGVAQDVTGRHIRFGLANTSAKLNKHIKSGDLVGITPRVISHTDVGKTLGIFTSIEVKKEGWVFTGTQREEAQARWARLISDLGGRAAFISHPDQLR